MKHIPRKRFGQHFLTDEGLIADIVRRIAPQPSDRLVEIGPGLGALTQPLLERCGHITVVELDRDLIAYWQQRSGVTVVASDVLKVDFAQNAESYGCRAWRVNDEQSLLAALEASRAHPGPTLLDIKVLPKTMTHDYASWWRTGDAQVAASSAVREAAEQTQAQVKKARQY